MVTINELYIAFIIVNITFKLSLLNFSTITRNISFVLSEIYFN